MQRDDVMGMTVGAAVPPWVRGRACRKDPRLSLPVLVASVALASAAPADGAPATPQGNAATAPVEVAPAETVPPATSVTSAPVATAPAEQAPAPAAQAPVADAAKPALVVPPPPPTPYVPGAPIVVSGHTKAPPEDPIEQVNAKSFAVVTKVDEAVVGPIAKGYEKGVPRPLRMGLRNFIRNLTEPVVFLNYMLQLKPGKAAETVGRFAVNSTVGVAGLVDVAKKKPFNLPYRANGLANTLGYYGIGPGPYLFLPLVGPTTVRDLFGLLVDRAVVPVAVGKPFNKPTYALPMNTIESIDDRNQVDADLQAMRASDDPYTTYRTMYLKTREYEIEALHGRGPLAKGEMGVAPFARPLHGDVSAPAKAPAVIPAPAAATPPQAEAAPVPAAPVQPTFVSIPVVQPLPNE